MSRKGDAIVSSSSLDEDAILGTLSAALRAPSAHNAQPWRLSHRDDHDYMLWYAYRDKLRADPDDRDGLIAVGGFFETLRLNAQARGLDARFTPAVSHHAEGIDLGLISMVPIQGEPDPLASAIEKRQCNRHPYERSPLSAGLAAELVELGNTLLPAHRLAGLVRRASILSWKDRRFVADLEQWTRFDDVSPDGMTLDCLRVTRPDQFWLRLALRLGRLPAWLAWAYAERDVRLTRRSSAMAVLTVESREPLALFDCGRRLIRSWTLLNSLGYSWHPMSVVIDQATVTDLGVMIGGLDPVAIYRVGYTPDPAAWSHRRALDAVLIPAPA